MRTQKIFVAVCVLAVGAMGATREAASSSGNLASALSGTAWQLKQITLVGDSVRPDDGTKYTIVFGPNKRAQIRADCNRGIASWRTGDDDDISFGAVKLTRMKCRSGSIDKRFVNDLGYVRSFSLEDGKLSLHLVRGAGSLDFEPMAK